MVRERAVLAILVGAILMNCTVPASGQGSGEWEPLTVYRLEPYDRWELADSAYASAQRKGAVPGTGWSNAAAVSFPITVKARFDPDKQRAELSVQFIPVSGDIRTNASNLFIAPLSRRLEWKLVITVRNPNDIVMRNVKVRDEFGQAFRVTLAGRPHGDARIEGDAARGGLPLNPALVWDIGDLAPAEAPRAELTMVTRSSCDHAFPVHGLRWSTSDQADGSYGHATPSPGSAGS
ncbi:MAG: hypothetical protein QME82_01985 [Bacillota bacterium]|nr:hypothetical protein [Bacillota bacterium]